jgi:predicted dehydrogenase
LSGDRVSIGLVGCGGMGVRHLHAYAALDRVEARRFDLAAVCDPRPEAADHAAAVAEALLGSRPAVFTDHEELIAGGAVEALDVVTDPAVHQLVAAPALDQGLHVLCEKPLGITVRACRAIVDAAARSGAVLATAENYRRDPANRLARAVIEQGLLGELHLMIQTNVGGDDAVIVSPWRHIREAGPIALDMGVHYTDILAYYLGDLERVTGTTFVAEPLRTFAPGAAGVPGIEEVRPGVMRATGKDSLVALYESASGVQAQLAYLPSGPGRMWFQRTVHGRGGSMSVPQDRSGGPVVVQLGDRVLSGAELRRALGGFELDGMAARLFGREGTEYDLPFADVDAATIGIEIDDFATAVIERRSPEIDGIGGLTAVAAVWAVAESHECGGAVRIADVADGTVSAAQDHLDAYLGLLSETSGEVARK